MIAFNATASRFCGGRLNGSASFQAHRQDTQLTLKELAGGDELGFVRPTHRAAL
jgi:hypothetical protein